MAVSAPNDPSSWGPPFEARGSGERHKYWKMLGIFIFLQAAVGCAGAQGPIGDRDQLIELQEENVRLEAQITRLREENLRAGKGASCHEGPRPAGAPADTEPGAMEPPADLPVVRMGPDEAAPTDRAVSPEGGSASVRPAAPVDEAEPEPQPGTRPVLKVRGQHEAWVYHRPVVADEEEQSPHSGAPVPPATGPSSSQSQPSAPQKK